jgi:NADP-dependent 3-hydroxy acid dehydrogenase YdfG
VDTLKDKIVFISGATSGIGKSCAYAFAKEGANLIINARRKNLIDEIGEDLKNKFGIKVYGYKLDVRNRNEVEDSIDNLPDEWKNIDILINNAGLAKGLNKFHEDDPDNWEEMIDTNIKRIALRNARNCSGNDRKKIWSHYNDRLYCRTFSIS